MASVICLTTGEPGAGKTYVRASRYLVDDFLLNSDGIHISNFPLKVDVIAKDVSARLNVTRHGFFAKIFSFFGVRRSVITEQDIKNRLVIIPDDVMLSWRREESGPWEYFADCSLKGAHIAIDEIHEYVSFSKSSEYLKKWDEFLGQIRHRGCTFEGLTQDIKAVHPILVNRSGIRFEIFTCENMRDPFFHIPFYDWYNLKAAFTGCFHKTVFEVEKRKAVSGRWTINNVKRFLIVPEYFVYYDSFSASHLEREAASGGVVESNRTPLYEYQKRGKCGLVFWFVYRNFFQLFSRLLIVVVFVWLCFFGGFTSCFMWFIDSVTHFASSDSSKKSAVPAPSAVPSSSVVPAPSAVPSSSSSVPSDVQADSSFPVKSDSPYRPVFFDDSSCLLSGGLSISLGYIFTKGSLYEGRRVVFIDSRLRCYGLDDGCVIWMRDVVQ